MMLMTGLRNSLRHHHRHFWNKSSRFRNSQQPVATARRGDRSKGNMWTSMELGLGPFSYEVVPPSCCYSRTYLVENVQDHIIRQVDNIETNYR